MKVERIHIDNFRSISSCDLSDCGGFNVLIGRNNSGKSNILSAINAFFWAVSDGDVVHLGSPINKEVDFYNNNVGYPAEVVLTFLMTETERAALVADIIEDYPQVANAVNALDPESRLRVRVCFNLTPTAYAYVSRITLVPRSFDHESIQPSDSIILDIGHDAAQHFYSKHVQFRRHEARTRGLRETLDSMDREDWARMKTHSSDDFPALRRPPSAGRRASLDRDTVEMLESMADESETFDDFRNSLRSEMNNSARYAEFFDKHNLDQGFVETFSGTGTAIPNHVLNVLRRLSQVRVLNVTDDRKAIGEEEARRLLSLKTQRGGQEPLDRIQGVVSVLLGVKIDAFSSEPTLRRGTPPAELDVDNFVVEVNGSGIKEALRLLLDIEFENPDLLLVEEPEIHLHPGLETAMMRHLEQVSQRRQVFITTHSTNFLDTAVSQKIFMVSKDESTTANLLDRGEVEEQIPAELGIRLSSLFIYDRLVFVEGPSDEEILRACASTLDVNLDQYGVGFVHLGGSRSLSYFASGTTLSFLSNRGVKMWFLIDRDEKNDEDIRKIKESLGNAVDSSVLSKREIENYLIHPRTLADQISARLNQNDPQLERSLDPDEIAAQVDEAAENLKKITILKRVTRIVCHPLYPERSRWWEKVGDKTVEERINEQFENWDSKLRESKNSIISETERQTAEVEAQWNDRKLDLVEGELLLDALFNNYGLQFRKLGGDGAELAKRMTKEEIGPDLEKLIKNIAG